MYRLLLLFALLSTIAAQHSCHHNHHPQSSWRKCHRHKPNRPPRRPDKLFSSIADEVIKTDLKLQEYCNRFPKDGVKEIYEIDSYKLIYPAQDLVDESIEIIVKHRILYLNAEKKSNPGRNKVDLIVLPDIVNATQAEWSVENDKIEIWMPYRIVFNKEIDKTCDGEIISEQTIIPRYEQDIDQTFVRSFNPEMNKLNSVQIPVAIILGSQESLYSSPALENDTIILEMVDGATLNAETDDHENDTLEIIDDTTETPDVIETPDDNNNDNPSEII